MATVEALMTKAAVEVATKALIETIIKPMVVKGFHGLKNITDSTLDLYVDRLSEYVKFQYSRHSYLNTIVFGHKKKLEELYLPLTVYLDNKMGSSPLKTFKLSGFNDDFLPTYKKVLITDTAGMGKSTLSKFLLLKCIETKKSIPFFVELRQLSKDKSILDLVTDQIRFGNGAESEDNLTRKRIERIIKAGGFCFFFDGYDEISLKERETVTKDLKDFVDKFTNNICVITSRPESGLSSFPEFYEFSIKPLEKKESYELIKKYDQDGQRSSELISKLEGGMFASVSEFLKNPLLTTLLYRCFEYKQQIPLKKHIFYRQVFDALYDWHDSTKDGYNTREKKSNLDQDSFHKVLRMIGFISVMKGTVEGDVDTVLGWIRHAQSSCNGLNFNESDFLNDLVKAVPVFVKDGLLYRWSHKSLAEYFAAQYICNEGKLKQETILTRIIESEEVFRFVNVLDQIYDMDDDAFRKYITWPTFKAFDQHWNNLINIYDQSISSHEVRLRLCVSFGVNLQIYDLSKKPKNQPAISFASSLSLVRAWDITEKDSRRIFIGGAINQHCLVFDILAAKKDSLVNRLEQDIATMKEVHTFIWPKQAPNPIQLTADPKNILNSPDYFVKTTNMLLFIRKGVVINHEKVTEFLANYHGNPPGLGSLTEDLLGGLTVSNTTSKKN